MKRYVMFMAAIFSLLCLISPQATEAAPRLSVQITLYDLETDPGSPVALGKAPLSPIETKASLESLAPDSRGPYNRDVFYLKRMAQDNTGAVRFRVRHEQIIDSRCTAMEIRDYTLHLGDTCELYSDRGQVRAVMKLSVSEP